METRETLLASSRIYLNTLRKKGGKIKWEREGAREIDVSVSLLTRVNRPRKVLGLVHIAWEGSRVCARLRELTSNKLPWQRTGNTGTLLPGPWYDDDDDDYDDVDDDDDVESSSRRRGYNSREQTTRVWCTYARTNLTRFSCSSSRSLTLRSFCL